MKEISCLSLPINVKGMSEPSLHPLFLTQINIYNVASKILYFGCCWNLERSKVCKMDDVTGRWLSKLQDADLPILPLLGEDLGSRRRHRILRLSWPDQLMNRAPSKQRDWQTHLIHRLVIVKSITHALFRTPPLLRKNTKRERGWSSWKPSPANWSGPSFKNKQEDREGYLPAYFIDERARSSIGRLVKSVHVELISLLLLLLLLLLLTYLLHGAESFLRS